MSESHNPGRADVRGVLRGGRRQGRTPRVCPGPVRGEAAQQGVRKEVVVSRVDGPGRHGGLVGLPPTTRPVALVDSVEGGDAVVERGNAFRMAAELRAELAPDLKAQYEQGATIRALAVTTGRSYGYIRDVLTEGGVALRGRGHRMGPTPAEHQTPGPDEAA